jgi:hypothetical protein
MRLRAVTGAILCSAILSATSCHEAPSLVCPCGPPHPLIESVLVAPDTATITVGQTLRMTVTVRESADSTYSVAWSSSNATGASVDSTGLVTGKAASPGVAICATASSQGASVENCATVIVQPAPSNFGPTVARPWPRRVGGSA